MLHVALLIAVDLLPLDELYLQRSEKQGVDAFELKVYWCLRGSSSEESMHGQFNKLLKGGNYSPEVAQVGLHSNVLLHLMEPKHTTNTTQSLCEASKHCRQLLHEDMVAASLKQHLFCRRCC